VGARSDGIGWLSSDLSVGRAFLDDPLTTSEPLRSFRAAGHAAADRQAREEPSRDVPLLMIGATTPSAVRAASIVSPRRTGGAPA
jgi:hypothetical protein